MRIAIGHKIQKGPWGGGNNFAKSIVSHLQQNGHEVFFDLKRKDLDVILITDPRPRNPAVSFNISDVFRYKVFQNKRVKVFHRINECDERKGTKFLNFRLRNANAVADHTIFIASWLRGLRVWNRDGDYSVILNGADTNFFNRIGKSSQINGRKIKIVTHHWGGHLNKGFDIYKYLDEMLDKNIWSDKFEFTYIGNLPRNFSFKNVTVVSPLQGIELGEELKKHDIYLTASLNEPAGMHHVEGALCGLPILYRNSGALPEYCENYGVGFHGTIDFQDSLNTLVRNYKKHAKSMITYPNTEKKMVQEYEALFNNSLPELDQTQNIRFSYNFLKSFVISQFLIF